MTMTLAMVTIDCADAHKLAEFWTGALGLTVAADYGDSEYVMLRPRGGGVAMGLQRVPEPRTAKNRVHLDFVATDRAAEARRLVGIGATVVGEHEMPGLSWTVLADPEDNLFCVGEVTEEAARAG